MDERDDATRAGRGFRLMGRRLTTNEATMKKGSGNKDLVRAWIDGNERDVVLTILTSKRSELVRLSADLVRLGDQTGGDDAGNLARRLERQEILVLLGAWLDGRKSDTAEMITKSKPSTIVNMVIGLIRDRSLRSLDAGSRDIEDLVRILVERGD